MAKKALIGTWEVTNCEVSNFDRCSIKENDLEGVRFTLTKTGDLYWTVPEEISFMPLFKFNTYEYHIKTLCALRRTMKMCNVYLRIGGYAGHVLEFRVYNIKAKQRIILSSKNFCEIDCRYVKEVLDADKFSGPFSLLPALEEGFFSDITILAKNKRQFKVHSLILNLEAKEINWRSEPPPFSDISEDALGTILHFLYTECLPEELSVSEAGDIIKVASEYKCLERLTDYCRKYIKRMELRNQIITILNDMHSGMEKFVDYLSPSVRHGSQQEAFLTNPATLYNALKQSFREQVVVIAKFIQLCDIFASKEHNLSNAEQDEILSLFKSKIPIFNQQFRKFLEGLKKIYRSMTPVQRVEAVAFIVPEIDTLLASLISLIDDVDILVQEVIQNFSKSELIKHFRREDKSWLAREDKLSCRLARLVHRMEITQMMSVHETIKMLLEMFSHKKECYVDMPTQDKVHVVARILDYFIKEELPVFLTRLDEIVDIFDEKKLDLFNFKFFFKAETSKIVYFLKKFREQINAAQKLTTHACELVQRDSFTQTMQSLNLIPDKPSVENNVKENNAQSSTYGHRDLNLVKELCTPPPLKDSRFSKNTIVLLNDQLNTDMEFEVICDTKDLPNEGATNAVPEKSIIKAHRVIVAARCNWFRRALLSGMREAIDKKIVIHDTNPALFKIFLEYLYSGVLNRRDLSTDQLLELILLSDRYEMDSLKQTCEHILKSSIDFESALYLLGFADQYNANILKKQCIKYISEHNEITECEDFCELPISLQSEIFDLVWTQPKLEDDLFNSDPGDMPAIFFSSPDSYSQEGRSLDTSKSSRLESHVAELQSILGDVPKYTLVELILAADYNLERAVNFYYSDSVDTI